MSPPDIRRQIKARLLALPPRAFELFAGDLLEFMGLREVAVTRYGHAMAIPAPGSLHEGPWHDDRLAFAHADWAGYSVFEEAFTRGHLAAEHIARRLRG